MSAAIALPERLDISAAAPLCDRLRSQDGEIHLDAGAVEHLGMLCLQVLLAAARDPGRALRIDPASAAFHDALACAGLAPDALDGGAT